MSRFIVEKQLRVSGGAKGDIIARGASSFDNLAVGPNGQVLTADSTQSLGVKWAAAPITSVFTRGGAIVATTGDYTASQVTNVPAGSIAATDVQAAINELDTEKAATGHTHTLDNLSDVTIAAAANGEVLTFNSVSGEWENQAPTGGIADPGANGILARTALNVTAARTLTAGSTKLSISNGDGVSGNPTLDVVEANLSHANIGGVTAIANGGTGQTTAAAAFAALSPLTTKGDVLTRDASGHVRKAVGADGQALVASSASSDGLAWQTLGGTVPSGLQGQKLSFGAGDVLAARDFIVLAEDYGAVGDGVVDDFAALQAAINAVKGTGKTLWLSKTYKSTQTLLINQGNFTVDGGGTILFTVPAVGSQICIDITGTSGGVTTDSTTAIAFADRANAAVNSITVTSAAGLSVGDLVQLFFDDGSFRFSQLTTIKDISGSTLSFSEAVKIPLENAPAGYEGVTLITPVKDIKIRNIIIDGVNSSGSATLAAAFRAQKYSECTFENITIRDLFPGTNQPCLITIQGYKNKYENIKIINSGANTQTARFNQESFLRCSDLVSVAASTAFGPEFTGTDCNVSDVQSSTRATSATARGFTIGSSVEGMAHGKFDNIAVQGAFSTGYSTRGSSYNNISTNISVFGCTTGIWHSGQQNIYNMIIGASSFNSGDNLTLAATDDNNTILQIQSPQEKITDAGSANVIVTAGQSKSASVYSFEENFESGNVTTGQIGAHGFAITSVSGTLTVTKATSAWPTFGVLNLATGGVSGNGGGIGLGNAVWGDLAANVPWYFSARWQQIDGTSFFGMVGLADAPDADPPSDGMWVQFDTGAPDTSWSFVCRAGGSQTKVASGVTGIDLKTVAIWSTVAGTINFSLDGGATVTQISTNVPTALMQPVAMEFARASAVRNMRVDWFRFEAPVGSAWEVY